jgi:hypothetical protein
MILIIGSIYTEGIAPVSFPAAKTAHACCPRRPERTTPRSTLSSFFRHITTPRTNLALHVTIPMEKYGYPPVQTPIRERRQAFPSSSRSSLKYICIFAALFFLALWHLGLKTANKVQVMVDEEPLHWPASDPKLSAEKETGDWRGAVDDGTWKVPLEAHIMFVYTHHLPTSPQN